MPIASAIEELASLPRALAGVGLLAGEVAESIATGSFLPARGIGVPSKQLPPVVIGENMERVKAYARKIGAQHIGDFIPENEWTLERNIAWIQQMMREGRRIIDIGPDFPRRLERYLAIRAGTPNIPHPVSTPYSYERRLLKGYDYYEKRFVRRGKWWGNAL